ncbi:MAG: UvrD-helicase domain-containing protein [Syntrophobacterales bacterium]|jgi:ATP-dependent exoDNAse (exonuclease V) beta subunit|nr:UvrD-helicase domain-containing protein [Syntrophobacterales bacterium]
MAKDSSPPTDQAVRDQALGYRESFHLEAPAGSGKTSVLLARFLTLLARVDAPEEMLALTFTRKAAGELRARVMGLLWERQDPGPEASPLDLKLRELVQQVFRKHGDEAHLKLTPERLPIMTFHGFCAQLLKLAPQEAGAPLEFKLLEEDEARWLKAEALEELRSRLNARRPADPVRRALVRRLVRLNNDWRRLAKELDGLLSRRDSLGEFLGLARVSRDAAAYQRLLQERFRLVLLPVLEALRAALAGSALGLVWGEFWGELQGSPHGDLLPAAIPGTGPADLIGWQGISQVLLTASQGELRKRLSPKDGFPEGFNQKKWSALIQDLPGPVARRLKQCRDLAPAGASPEEAAALQDLVILVGEALGVFEQLCAHRGALDFVALEAATLNLLSEDDPTEIMLRLDWRLKHILVDEFQDTSQNQMHLLCRLMAGWQGAGGRTLMVVGDPKQSIYGWRQAKPRLFMESRQGLPCGASSRLPLTPMWLTTNFRATRTLIAWVNQVFEDTIMTGGTAGADFHRAEPRPGAPEGLVPHLAFFTGGTDLAARELEARWLARQVAQALPGLKDKETIGILLFTRKHLPLYLQALSEAGLAVRVREGLKLADSRVVTHLHNLARALVRPQDQVAWAGVLRGPWAPQALDILARVAQTTGKVWPEKLRPLAGEADCPGDLADLAASLGKARDQVGRRPLAEILTEWLDGTRAWAGIAAWEGPLGVANARTYLDLLAAAEAGLPEATFGKADFNLEEAFQPPDPRAAASQVEILTVHGAKGLEFDQVFLPFLDWQPLKSEDNTPPFLLEEIPESRVHGLALARPYAKEKQSPLYVLLRDVKNQRVVDEARRVFYVAVTRARQRLVMSAVAKTAKNGGWQVSGDSPLAWLKGHYRQDLPDAGPPLSWPDPEVEVELVTAAPPLIQEAAGRKALPDAWDFQPEAAPYEMISPSRLAAPPAEAQRAPETEAPEGGDAARLRGEVMHRALQTLARGGPLPDSAALAAALRQSGLPAAAAAGLAPEMRAELEACRADPFLAALLRPETDGAASEWLLEDRPRPGAIRRGVIDRLAFDGQDWWILDYKSSRPAAGENWEAFMAREAAKYRPQLLAYREMAAKARGLKPPGAIRLGVYFTACRQVVEI